jgi:hypothetical protein
VLYPFDVVYSSVEGVGRVFREGHGVSGGPAGALAGILLPWVTVSPGYSVSPHEWREATPEAIEVLVAAIEYGPDDLRKELFARYEKEFGLRIVRAHVRTRIPHSLHGLPRPLPWGTVPETRERMQASPPGRP